MPALPRVHVVHEFRSAPRHPASAVRSITGLGLSPPGVDAKLVNISTTGLLAECSERIKPGSLVTIVFEGSFVPQTLQGRVARNTVAAMGPGGSLRYHVGLAFTQAIDLGDWLPLDDAVSPLATAPSDAPVASGPAVTGVRNRW
jgi:PilZ domain